MPRRLAFEACWPSGDFDGYLKHTTERMKATGNVDSNRAGPAATPRPPRPSPSVANCRSKFAYLTMSVELDPNVDRLIDLSDALTSTQRIEESEQRLRKAPRAANPRPPNNARSAADSTTQST